MRIGIGLPNQVRDVNPAAIVPWSVRAERAGFAVLATAGRIAYPGIQDTVALAAAAAVTSTIGLFTNVLLGPAWSPVLLAKEAAGIDGISGGRLTLGLGLGVRPDDFTVDGRGPTGLGKIMNADLEVYRHVWSGGPIAGGSNPGVPAGTRPVPLLFGGNAPRAYARMARWGVGYTAGASAPPEAIATRFASAREAWSAAGREGAPKLVSVRYFALGDPDRSIANLVDYYGTNPAAAQQIAAATATTPAEVRAHLDAFEAIGTDELILNPGTDDPDEVDRLAEIVF